jgi:hypothetical protein
MSCTSRQSIPRWALEGAIAAIVVAGIGVVGAFGAPSGAQEPAPPSAISDGPLDLADAADGNRSLAISDDGAVVAYDTGSATADNRVVVRDRVTGTTILAVAGARPALSADGCTVAVSTSTTSGASGATTTTLTAHDLCASDPARVVATAAGKVIAQPALSADGSIIVWSRGGAIARHVDTGSGYAVDATFTPAIPAGEVAGDNVDVSADGAVVTFEVVPTGGTTDQTEVWVWDDSTTAAAAIGDANAHRPTISGDGRIVAVQSGDVSLVGTDAPVPLTPFVAAYDRDRAETALVAEEAWRPVLSSDGHHVVYRQADDLVVAWWGAGQPFESVGHRSLGRTLLVDDAPAPDAPLASISAHGRWTAFDGDDGATVSDDDTDDDGTWVWVAEERPAGGGEAVDLGTVAIGDTLDTSVTITNDSSAGAALDGAVIVDSPFSVVSTTCATPVGTPAPPDGPFFVLQPGASCTARVRAVTSVAGAITAGVGFPVAGEPGVVLTASLRATVTAPSSTSSEPPTTPVVSTTPVASTTIPQPTLPVGTAPTRPPVFNLPRSSGGFPSSGGSGSSSSSGSSGSSPSGSSESSGSATTTTGSSTPGFDPPKFEFAPTIVDSGVRTATVTLVNPTVDTLSVVDVAIDPASAAATSFSVDASACSGTALPGGAACAVDVTFAPVATGDLESAVLASFGDGSLARGELSGFGAEPPVLTVVPGVASNGQVVSVIGAGFPAGATVELSWDGVREVEHVEVSDIGDLAHTLIVLPHTPRGPSTVIVLGQDGLFGDVSAEVLVTNNSSRPGSVVMRGLSPVRN